MKIPNLRVLAFLVFIAAAFFFFGTSAAFAAGATTAETDVLETPVQVTGSTADVKVDVTNPDPSASYFIQVGITLDNGATCSPTTPALEKAFGNNQKTGTLEYAGVPLVIGQTYCAGLGKSATLAPIPTFTYFTGASNTFSVASLSNAVTPQTTTSPTPTSPNAYGCSSTGTSSYCMLAPLPGIGKLDASGNPTGYIDETTGIGAYLNGIIRLILGLIGVMAVFMIVVGGIEYMSTVSIGEKEGAKSRITSALLGLLLALASYLILNTINPSLVNVSISVPSVSLTLNLSQNPGDDGLGVPQTPSTSSGSSGGYTGKTVSDSAGDVVSPCDTSSLVSVPISSLDNGTGIFSETASSIQVNKAVSASLIAVFAQYEQSFASNPALASYKIVSIGGYNCRVISAGQGKGVQSGHAYGLAVDINPTTNPRFVGQTTPLTSSQYDIPQALISAFAAQGWGWGGNWNSLKDAMHFSKLQNEQGSGANSYSY